MNISWVGRAHRCILKHDPLINEDLDGINTRESSRFIANTPTAVSSNPRVISMKMIHRFSFLDFLRILVQNIIIDIMTNTLTSFQRLALCYNTILFFLNNPHHIFSCVISMEMVHRFSFLHFSSNQNIIDKRLTPFLSMISSPL